MSTLPLSGAEPGDAETVIIAPSMNTSPCAKLMSSRMP